MIALTHIVFGLSIAFVLEKRLITASVFAVVADFDITFDFLYPFTSNGIMHSLLAAGIFSLLVFVYSEDRESAESCFLGYISHLGLDSITSYGVQIFFPLQYNLALGIASAEDLVWNLGIITIFLSAMFVKKNWQVFRPFLSFR